MCSGAFAANAIASPYWAFGGTILNGTETVVGEATQSSLTFPGLTTKCTMAPYEMEIWNTGTNGVGELTSLSFSGCTTDSASCTVASVTVNGLPWPLHLTKVATNNYVILEHVNVTILYAGEECILAETPIPVTGTAGGSFNNVTSLATFNSTTFTTTKTELKVGKTKVEWKGILTTGATGPHSGQALEVG